MAQRYDIGTLQPAKRRADGTVVAEAYLTRSGVFTYANNDGTLRREYRPDAEVFAPDSLSSFSMVPVTDDHPPELLTAKNARQYAVGSTGESIRKDGSHVFGTLAVHDARTIAKMDGGKLQVSCGYECDVDETPGIAPSGERYDAIQRNIRGNHLAIVARGRADSARLRMDAAVMRQDEIRDDAEERNKLPAKNSQRRDDSMDPDLKKALEDAAAQKVRADSAEKERDAQKKRADELEAQRDSLKEKFDAAEKARQDAVSATPALVRARVELETKSAPHLGKEFKMDGVEDVAIKLAVIKKITNVDVSPDKSADYITARFDAALERAETSAEVFRGAHAAIAAGRADSGVGEDEKAKAEHMKHSQSLFIKPSTPALLKT